MDARVVIRIIAVTLITGPLFAQPAPDHASHHADSAATSTVADAADGEVRRVDRSAGKVTIRHGEIRSLGMPAMTMVFRVTDPGMLDRVKEGDRIRFSADKVDGLYTVTAVEVVK